MMRAYLLQMGAIYLALFAPLSANAAAPVAAQNATAKAPAAAPEKPPEQIAEAGAKPAAASESTGPETSPDQAKPAKEKPASLGDTLKETVDDVTKAGGNAVKNIGKAASDVTSATPKESGETAAKLINDIQDISFGRIILIIIFTWFSIWLSRLILPYLAKRGPSQMRLYLLGAVPIIRLILLVTAIMWIIPLVFNVTLQNFLVIAGAASVAIGFAFKDYASSLIAGVVALFERPYRPGDWVKIDGDYGEVKSVGLRAISLVTSADNVVTVPHDRIWTNNIVNSNDGARTLMCIADFYLAPGHDGARMRSVLWDVAISSAYLNYEKPVLVMLNETPWGTHYKLKAYPFDLRDQFSFISDMTVRGKLAIAEAGGLIVTAPAAVGGSDGNPLPA